MIVPCYNEEDVLPITAPLFLKKIQSLIEEGLVAKNSRIVFVDDGSKDDTWKIISNLSKQSVHCTGLRQSRNRGHQNAVYAGLMESKNWADITISIDCDGQDDIDAMDEMIFAYMQGAEIVYGVRNDRDSDKFFKKTTAHLFYKMLDLMGVEAIYNHADYRLVSSKVLNEFKKFDEVNLFLRGMFPLVGFNSSAVYYKRNERVAGKSKYPLNKMINLAFDGITSLSVKPIRLVTVLGLLMAFISFLVILWIFIKFFSGQTVSGWASNGTLVSLFCGVQL
ncbi:TPA: glycosyltransferase family 2 protein, partial [Streptococcus suis]|nr:glycosyltransferase family 2 protein [Streptococcus suis]